MPYSSITSPAVGDPTRKDTFADIVVSNLDFLNAQLQLALNQGGIPNGSFEVGTGANTAPSGWGLNVASGNSSSFETSAANTRHGAQAFSMTNPGGVSGGVTLESEDFIPFAQDQELKLYWLLKSTSATTRNQVFVKWYSEAEALISTTTVYDASSGNPTSWTFMGQSITPPSGSKFFKVTITGVNNSTAASSYWDGISVGPVIRPRIVTFLASGTYTPTPGVTAARARLIGGAGGGGAGQNAGSSSGQVVGGSGGISYVGSDATLCARGGNGGQIGVSGNGGAAIPANYIGYPFMNYGALAGQDHKASVGTGGNGGTVANPITGLVYGGGYAGSAGEAGGAATANTGAGGGGAGATTSGNGGGGGGSGEYAEYIFEISLGQTFPVVVGAGGSAGTGPANPGGAGGSGIVVIEELR